MEKINDMFLATLANPQAKTLDFLNNNVLPENTRLLSRDEYKTKKTVQDRFSKDGKFDDEAFNNAYDVALFNYNRISDEKFIEKINQVEYSPFDVTRPLDAKTYNVDVTYTEDFNPMRNLYSRGGINLITPGKFSQRELAQASDVFDPKTQTWLGKSANELGFFDKWLGDTLVYAAWDDDGVHVDPFSGRTVNHKKGEWKINDKGDFFIEKLAGREIYGKQIVNPTDILTTDGSVFNRFDFFDADGREKSLGSTALRTVVEIAPFLIPGVAPIYGGVKAAVGLSAVLPTFFKSMESLLRGDNTSFINDPATEIEGYMAKFVQRSTSDKASESFFNGEQILSMVSDIFSQIYEQRAMAGLSNLVYRPDKLLNRKAMELQMNASIEAGLLAKRFGTTVEDIIPRVLQNLPELQDIYKAQSRMSKALSLGYMALTSTGEIYGEALESGYDRKTAGFASLLAASGTYALMMNNRMGDWFLDKTTGYNVHTSRALMSKSVKPFMKEIQEVFSTKGLTNEVRRNKLAEIATKAKASMNNLFTGSSVIGEAMLKHSIIEGIEEVTEELVLDATRGIVDVMSYLGLTKERGSFDTLQRFADGTAFQEYLANFVGGLLGGAMFEFERSKITPWIENKGVVSPPTMQNLYDLIASGKKNELIAEIKRQAGSLANGTLSYLSENGEYLAASDKNISQQELITNKAIEIITRLDNVINSEGLGLTDEDVIARAVRQKVVIDKLNELKPEGKNTGIEAIVLHDFKNTGLKIDKIKAKILELEKIEGNEKQIQREQEKLVPLTQKYNSILSGENSSKYFTQLLFGLSSNINKYFGTLDIDSFTKAKYNKSYDELPDKDSSISKETVTEEWNEFIDSADIYEKLSTMTEAYLETERKVNPIIQDYVESGYLDVRKEIYDTLINITKTFENFETLESKEKNQKILNFIELNNKLERLKLNKVLPWDSLNLTFTNKLEADNLLRKISYSKNSEGEWIQTISEGDYNKELFDNNLTKTLSAFSPDYLVTEDIINSYNNSVNAHNLNILQQIDSSDNADEIANLQSQIIDTIILDFEGSSKYNKLKQDFDSKIDSLKTQHNITDEQFVSFNAVKNNEKLYADESLVQEIELDEETNEYNINSDKAKDVYRFLTSNGLLSLVTLSTDEQTLLSNVDKNLDTLENLSEEEISLITKLNNIIFELQSQGRELLSNEALNLFYRDMTNADKRFNDLVTKHRPDFLNIKNLAFDSIMSVLENGFNDGELFKAVKDIYDANLTGLKKSLFKNDTEISDNEFLNMLNNRSNYENVLAGFGSAIGNYGDISVNEVLEMLEAISEGAPVDNYNEVLQELYYDIEENGFELTPENLKMVRQVASADDLLNLDYDTASVTLSNKFSEVSFMNLDLEIANRFINFTSKQDKLLNNPIYEFLRKFSVTLDPTNRVSTVLDILENEEVNYKASSGASNFFSDNIREGDIVTASNVLEMIKSIVLASTTTQITGDDIIGFLGTRQDYARKTSTDLNSLELQTLNSEEAQVLLNDINRILVKLNFLKDLAKSNQTRASTEQSEIGRNMDSFRLNDWSAFVKTVNDEYIPLTVNEILNSSDSNFDKLRKIEDAVFEHNKHNPEKAFAVFLSKLPSFNYTKQSNINKDTNESEIEDYDKAIYFATILSSNSTDWWKQRAIALENSKKAPFYMQDWSARVVLARMRNPELFASLPKYKVDYKNYAKPEEGAIAPEQRVHGEYITTIMGSAGSGKSTAIMGTVLNIVKQTNPNSNIWLAAPQDRQKDNLMKAIISETGVEGFKYSAFNKDQLFKELGLEELHLQIKEELSNPDNPNNSLIKAINRVHTFIIPEELNIDASKLPNMIVIDEITHFSNPEILLLNEIEKRTKSVNIVTLGDPNQMGYQLKVKSGNGHSYLNFGLVGINTIKTPPLKLTVRASNELIRLNNELLVNLVSNITKIHDSVDNPNIAANDVSEYLNHIDTIKSLHYYLQDSDLKGYYITEGYNTNDFRRVKKIIEEKGRGFIILTEDGELSEEYLKVLQDVGLYSNGVLNENITVKNGVRLLEDISADKIQGSEIDHIIFDVDLINKFDKQRDKIRSLYTFASRSKVGAMIIGAESLEKSVGITNSEQAKYQPVEYQPLTEDVIEELKSQRLEEIKSQIGEDLTLSEQGFTWEGTEVTEEDIGRIAREAETPGSGNDPIDGLQSGFSSSEISTLRKTMSPNNFQIMIHSFYNNLGVEHILEDGQLSEIKVNSNNPSTDLNGVRSVNDKKSVTTILNEWANLKNDLLFNNVKKNRYKTYFEHIFGEDFDKTSDMLDKIDITFKVTAQRYDSRINNPYAKHGKSTPLESGDLFLNLSAELTYDGKSHFVTVATFANLPTFLKAIEDYTINEGDIEGLKIKAQNTFDDINERLDNLNPEEKLLILNDLSLDQVTKLTNTRFDKKDETKMRHNLSDLSKQFPGMKVSPLKLFPGKKTEFVSLLNRYTFGSERSNETVDQMYDKYKNKPYITVSFDNNLDGVTNKTAQARLVPVNSASRPFTEVVKEVRQLREELKNAYSADGKLNSDKRQEFNSKQQVLLSSPQILHVLAKWSTTTDFDGKPIINLLTDKVGENSVIDILSRFKNSDNETSRKLLEVIDLVKKETKQGRTTTDIVNAVIPQLSFKTGWTWNFFNLFDYDHILKEKNLDNKSELLRLNFTKEQDSINVASLEQLRSNVETLFSELPKNFTWYYNIPIEKGERGNTVVNKHVRGDNGFENAMFSDKFYLSGSPEAPRLLVKLENLLGVVTQNRKVFTPKVKPKIEPSPTIKPEVVVTDNIESTLAKIEGFSITKADGEIVKPLEGFTKNVYPQIKQFLTEDVVNVAIDKLINMDSKVLAVSAFLHELTGKSPNVTIGTNGFVNSRQFVEHFFGQTKNKELNNFIKNINNKLNQCK